ncbi:MAG: hypothetical protein AAFZ49_05845, partial [Cyanobacteria bacterium J06659_2]
KLCGYGYISGDLGIWMGTRFQSQVQGKSSDLDWGERGVALKILRSADCGRGSFQSLLRNSSAVIGWRILS